MLYIYIYIYIYIYYNLSLKIKYLLSPNIYRYAVSSAFRDTGILSAGDMTLESISAKLAYLMGRKDLDNDAVKTAFGCSLRGELTVPGGGTYIPPGLASTVQRL